MRLTQKIKELSVFDKYILFVWIIVIASAIFYVESTKACDPYYKITELAYFEARNQSFKGQLAVATVVMNRYYTGKYGKTVCEVVEKPHQFSYFWDGLDEFMTDIKAREQAEEVANCIVRNNCALASIKGATHYFACKGEYGIDPPYWTRYYTLVAEVDDHCFYQEENING